MTSGLGKFFITLQKNAGTLRWLFFGVLAALVALNFVILPHHPHVDAEHYPGFWAAFGLGVGVVLILLAKRALSHIVGVSEDFYE